MSDQDSVAAPVSDSANGGAAIQPEPDTKVFSQDEVNRIAGRARTEAIDKFAKDMGLANADDLGGIIKAQQEAAEASKTELQKAIDARLKAEQTAQKALDTANEKLIKAAFMAEAGKHQAAHPQDAYRLADLTGIKLTEAGEVEGVEAAVTALIENGRLTTSGKPTPPNLNGGAGSGDRPASKGAQPTQEEMEMARKMGVSIENYLKNK